MKRLLAALVAALVLVAAKPVPTEPSIAIADGSVLAFGGAVTFDVTVPALKGSEYPMVWIACSQDGTLVYGQLDHPYETFILGGGSSLWWSRPGPADCTATLYAYGGKSHGYDTIRWLAAVPFDANG